MATFENIKTLKDQVKWILDKFPETRNSDHDLIMKVCNWFHLEPVGSASSIERVRRHFNQKGQFLPTILEVAKQRKLNIDEWKRALGYHSALF